MSHEIFMWRLLIHVTLLIFVLSIFTLIGRKKVITNTWGARKMDKCYNFRIFQSNFMNFSHFIDHYMINNLELAVWKYSNKCVIKATSSNVIQTNFWVLLVLPKYWYITDMSLIVCFHTYQNECAWILKRNYMYLYYIALWLSTLWCKNSDYLMLL